MIKGLVILSVLMVSVLALAGPHHMPFKERGLFSFVDENKDGNISLEEHEAAVQKMVDRRRERFIAMDSNEDGLVSRDEAQQARESFREKMKEKHGKRHEKCPKAPDFDE